MGNCARRECDWDLDSSSHHLPQERRISLANTHPHRENCFANDAIERYLACMGGPLAQHFKRVRLSLVAKADEISIVKHGTLKGAARELVVSDFLSANLPRAFDFVTGEIVTPDDRRSGQIDVLVLPHTAPRFNLGGAVCLALVHAVAAALEIKSDLTTSAPDQNSDLTNAMETTVAVKDLPIVPPWIDGLASPMRRGALRGFKTSPLRLLPSMDLA